MFKIIYSKKAPKFLKKDAQKVWEMIRASFILANAETVEPEPDEIAALEAHRRGDPDYQPYISQEELMTELGL